MCVTTILKEKEVVDLRVKVLERVGKGTLKVWEDKGKGK